ncbi:hypothetical protein CCH79_00002472 [Gambusia affinis]|uniref:Uncharacterized protein n=1 Tax=Gambusia affinis TaxID=33528 RepID=A0A315VI17_GAMAF|nr:hypothetical protein CCH79_00002472 [Gambusia affinis]
MQIGSGGGIDDSCCVWLVSLSLLCVCHCCVYISLVSSSTPPQIVKLVFKSRFNLHASCLQEEEVEEFRLRKLVTKPVSLLAVGKNGKSLSQGSTNSNILDVQGGAHKKRVRRSSLLNAKKLYEDAQMARKVKQYLSNLTVETDEDKHQIMSLQCEPSYNTSGFLISCNNDIMTQSASNDGAVGKNLSERRANKSDMSPVSLRATLPSGKTQNRVSQVLQVQVPLNPLRKKSVAKDLGAANSNSPQVVKKPSANSSDEWSAKRPSDDAVSTVSSLHSSPTVSPQGSPRKVGGAAKSQNSSQMNLSGSSSSLTSDASTKTGTISLRSYGIGGALLHKRILQMTSQHSRESSRNREGQSEDEAEAGQEEPRRGRSRQQRKPEAGQVLPRRSGTPETQREEPADHCGSPPPPQPGGRTPIRARLLSPFRVLRERSQSRERPLPKSEEASGETLSSSAQQEAEGQTEQRVRRSVSPNPFLWLCRDRHSRRKTI